MPVFETPFARIEVPAGLRGSVIQTPTQHPGLAILRGEVAPGCPCVVVLTLQDRVALPFTDFVEEVADSLRGAASDPVSVDVPGAAEACRMEAIVESETGLGPDGKERLCVVIAEAPNAAVVLTVRTGGSPADSEAVRTLLGSLSIPC